MSTPDYLKPSPKYKEESKKWKLLLDLLGGTEAMRLAGKEWLPMEPSENPMLYENRLKRSILFNAYKDTVETIASKPFSKSVSLEKLDDAAAEGVLDLDSLDGTNLDVTQHARSTFQLGAVFGKFHLLVDHPPMPEGATLADEKAVTCTVCAVSPKDLIDYRYSSDDGELDLIRIYEKTEELKAGSQYEYECVERVRVFTRTEWFVYTKRGEQEWSPAAETGTHSFGRVPLVTVIYEDSPPLEELAWTNLAHWQSYSDHRNCLRFARVGILLAKNIIDEDGEMPGKTKPLIIGPNTVVRTTAADGDLRYVEHSGAAIAAGERDLKALEERMEVLGMKPFVARSASSTATGKLLDEGRTESAIQTWIRASERGYKQAFELAFAGKGKEPPKDMALQIFNDFGITMLGDAQVNSLIALHREGIIDKMTLANEIKRRGLLADSVDVQAMVNKAGLEIPSFATEPPDDNELPPGRTGIGFAGRPAA